MLIQYVVTQYSRWRILNYFSINSNFSSLENDHIFFLTPLKSGLLVWLAFISGMWTEVRCVISRNGQFVLYHFCWTTVSNDTADSGPLSVKSQKELKYNVEESY